MTTPTEISALDACVASLDALLADLDDRQWATPSLCPGWTVRDVVIHLAAVEHMMAGEAPGSFTESLPFDRVLEFMGEMEPLDNATVLDRFRAVTAQRSAELAEVTEEQLDLPSLTPVGAKTYGRFLGIRVFDFWVHEHDIRTPLGLPGHTDGIAAGLAIDEVEGSLPYIVGKKIGLPDGMGMTIELQGPMPRTMHVRVDGRAAVVDSLESPDVTLRAESTTFVQLACGRIDPQGPIDDGRVSWTGEDAWGDKAARNLAFTM